MLASSVSTTITNGDDSASDFNSSISDNRSQSDSELVKLKFSAIDSPNPPPSTKSTSGLDTSPNRTPFIAFPKAYSRGFSLKVETLAASGRAPQNSSANNLQTETVPATTAVETSETPRVIKSLLFMATHCDRSRHSNPVILALFYQTEFARVQPNLKSNPTATAAYAASGHIPGRCP